MPDRSRRAVRRLMGAVAAAVLLASLAATPSLAADPRTSGGVQATSARPAVQITRTVDLSRDSAIVRQYTSYYCVPASAQTMLNLIRGSSDRSRVTQDRLYRDIRAANKYRYPTRGNDVRGWARVLNARLGAAGAYGDVSFTSRSAAYAAIVSSMDRTGRPVGIVVDRGTHAWTVVGFRVRETVGVLGSQTILGFYVVGPLGPGSDPWPKAYYTVDQFATRFSRYHEWQFPVIWEGKFVIVAPTEAIGSVTTTR